MPPPSPLAISTASVQRLLKEEATYRTELASQETRLKKLERDDGDEDGNREWTLRQEVSSFHFLHLLMSFFFLFFLCVADVWQKQAIQETKAVFGPLREKILGAVEGLEGVLVSFFLFFFLVSGG